MKKIIYLLVVVIIISGCATTQWQHPSKTASDFEKDKYECMNQGVESTHQWGDSGNPFIIFSEAEKCLQYRYGWKKVKVKKSAR